MKVISAVIGVRWIMISSSFGVFMDLTTLGVAMGSAWLSGINLYATVLTLGLLERWNIAHLPGDLAVLGHPWVLWTAACLFVIQFIADKIPLVDSVWDSIHTFIRIPAGAILASTAFADFDPKVRTLAFLIGGGIALSSHATKTATRLAANTSPEPFSNLALSLAGDALSIGGSLLAALHPAFVFGLVIIAVGISILLCRWIYSRLRTIFRRAKSLDRVPAGRI